MEYECEKLKKQAEKSYRGCGYSLIGVIVLLIIKLLLCASCATKVVTVQHNGTRQYQRAR